MNIKQSGELQGILELLKEMAKFETRVAELYSLSAATWKENGQFWLGIWRDEIRHSRYVEQMMDMVRKEPQMFESSRSFDTGMLATVIKEIEGKTIMIRNGEATEDQILFAAQSVEQGYLESSFSDIVVTNNEEFRRLMDEISTDTRQHKDKIIEQIIVKARNKGYIKE